MINTEDKITKDKIQIINKLEIENPKFQSIAIWDLLRQFALCARVSFVFWSFYVYTFLFKAALYSMEIADLSIFIFPDIVSITAVVSASSETFP
jgi:hypothetical protein